MKRTEDVDLLLQLVEKVYAASLDESLWLNMAPDIAETFNSTSTTLQLPARGGGEPEVLSITGNLVNSIGQYREYFWQRDIWIDRTIALDISGIGASKDLLSDADFERSEFYRDWCRHVDVFYVLGAVFPIGPSQLGVLGIHRPRAAGTYEEEDKIFAARFLPHLQRAIQIRRHLAQAAFDKQVSLEALERVDAAVYVLGQDMEILFANAQAHSLLHSADGLVAKRGRLRAAQSSTNEQLSSLIRSAGDVTSTRTYPGGAITIPRRNGMPLTAQVYPFRFAKTGDATSSAIVFVRDPYRPISAIHTLRMLYGLTRAEARIAQGLANGQSLVEIAAVQGAHPQTVRKQLKAVFAKTGTNRQAQLVAVILRSIAALPQE